MGDFSNYPYPTYTPNKILAGIYGSMVFISLVGWLIQSVQNHFRPRRLVILLLVSHVSIFIELMIRLSANLHQNNGKVIHIVMTTFYNIGQRTIIISNFTCIADYYNNRSRLSRGIFLSISASILVADLLMAPAGLLSFQSNQIQLSFLFRQMSSAMVCLVSLLYYPIWFWTKTCRTMPYNILIALVMASVSSFIIALFLLIMPIPRYYLMINDDEEWFYFFQILPIVLTFIAWSILHPKRSSLIGNPSIDDTELILRQESSNVF